MPSNPAAGRPLLMIPGPVEISPAVLEAFSAPPPSHVAPELIEAFGSALAAMRAVWRAPDSARPLAVGGGGTIAMDMAAANLIEPGERAVVVQTGYFSDRMAEMLRRQGAEVETVTAPAGDAPDAAAVAAALAPRAGRPVKALFATHVDTSTGVLLDPEPLARAARQAGALSVFDGVCATAGERFEMAEWGADLYLTGSQKALSLPAGLALMVIGERALAARAARRAPAPPMYLDWHQWLPVLAAYEQRRPSYFSTPPTNLVLALAAGLAELLADGVERRWRRHRAAALALRAGWRELGLEPLPVSEERTAHTLSALRYPPGVDASLLGRIRERGVVVAGGLYPGLQDRYFRVGHMGWTVTRPELLSRTVEAVGRALADAGHRCRPEAAVAAFEGAFAAPAATG